jgi:hypothetical protein
VDSQGLGQDVNLKIEGVCGGEDHPDGPANATRPAHRGYLEIGKRGAAHLANLEPRVSRESDQLLQNLGAFHQADAFPRTRPRGPPPSIPRAGPGVKAAGEHGPRWSAVVPSKNLDCDVLERPPRGAAIG